MKFGSCVLELLLSVVDSHVGEMIALFAGVVCSLVRCLVRCFCVFFVVSVMVVSFEWHLLRFTSVSLHLFSDAH